MFISGVDASQQREPAKQTVIPDPFDVMGSVEALTFTMLFAVWWSLKKAVFQFPKDALPKHPWNRDCTNHLECADSHRAGVGDWALEMWRF